MNVEHPIVIGNKDVEFVSPYKYLGCNIQDELKWNVHVATQTKKAEKKTLCKFNEKGSCG